MLNWQSHPAQRFGGTLTVAGDKSISHRAIMFGALADGPSHIRGFLEGEDCLATLRAFQALGVPIERLGPGEVRVQGVGIDGLKAPTAPLDLGNSGTSMRLMMGILAGQKFDSVLVGDESLQKRPMRRVSEPLALMGAAIDTTPAGTAPLHIHGRPLRALDYVLPVASAQLKSALLLAALQAEGTSTITEPAVSRDHSERMLRGFGVELQQEGLTLRLRGGQRLRGRDVLVPGDISSAAFFIVAGLLAAEGETRLPNVGINPSRAAIIDLLREMGGHIELENVREAGGEPVADVIVRPSALHGIEIPAAAVPIAIDEFPILFIAAAAAAGTTVGRNLHELRVKESDRLQGMARNLEALGVRCRVEGDDIYIEGRPEGSAFQGGHVDSLGDHRLAMSFAVAGLRAAAPIEILNCANVATSFPTFFTLARSGGLDLRSVDA